MEGIPDHHEASAFTRRRQRWSRRLSHPPTRSKPFKRGTDGQNLQPSRKRGRREDETGVATGVSEARSRQHRGKKTPTLVSPGREAVELESSACTTIRRSGPRASWNVRIPGPTARSQRLRGASPQRKLRERAGNARGAGTRSSFGWQSSVGRIARLLHREVARPVGDSRGR